VVDEKERATGALERRLSREDGSTSQQANTEFLRRMEAKTGDHLLNEHMSARERKMANGPTGRRGKIHGGFEPMAGPAICGDGAGKEAEKCREHWCSRDLKAIVKSGKRWQVPLRRLGFPVEITTPDFDPREEFLTTKKNIGDGLKGLPRGSLPATSSDAFKDIKFGKCAVVGNSGILTLSNYGKDIDNYDTVVRMNQAPTSGYESKVGRKTSIRLLNRLWSYGYGRSRELHGKHLPLEKNVHLIASRGLDLVSNVKTLQSYMKSHHNDVKVHVLNSRLVSKTRVLMGGLRQCLSKVGISFRGGGVPTSGMVAIMTLKEVCDSVTVYGFGVKTEDGKRARYQYYTLANTQRSAMNVRPER